LSARRLSLAGIPVAFAEISTREISHLLELILTLAHHKTNNQASSGLPPAACILLCAKTQFEPRNITSTFAFILFINIPPHHHIGQIKNEKQLDGKGKANQVA
jgi:hypothetical protein